MTESNEYLKQKVIQTVERTIAEHRMAEKGDRILVGVSGGPDSVALLDILASLCKVFHVDLGVAHLNHGIRKNAAAQEALFVSTLAKNLGFPCHVGKKDVTALAQRFRMSVEHAGRMARYDFFLRIKKEHGYTRIAVGHHADDNAEVVLMALLRGSGPLGLAGIPPVRSQGIIRPLIRLSRREISRYLEIQGLAFHEDETNLDETYLRNKIRHTLLPLLKKDYNPKISHALNRLSDILRQEENWLNGHIKDELDGVARNWDNGRAVLSVKHLKKHHPAARRRILRMAIAMVKGDLKKITRHHVDAVALLVEKQAGSSRLDLPDRLMAFQHGETLTLSKERQPLRTIQCQPDAEARRPFSYALDKMAPSAIREINGEMTLREMEAEKIPDICSAGQSVAFFDKDKIKMPLIVRNFIREDRFVPQGFDNSVSVKRFLKKQHVPQYARQRVPVLTDGNGIIWVVGHRIDDSVKVTENTQKVLVSEIRWL